MIWTIVSKIEARDVASIARKYSKEKEREGREKREGRLAHSVAAKFFSKEERAWSQAIIFLNCPGAPISA